MTGVYIREMYDELNDFDAPVEEEPEPEASGLFDDYCYFDEDEDWDPYFDGYEAYLDDIRDELFLIQDQFASEDRPRSTRFTIHETWRWSWLGLDGTRNSELRVGCRVYVNYRAQSRREMRREWGDQARPGSSRCQGRKPVRKHRDRRPEMRNELQKLFRKTELNRIDPIELAQMDLDENGEFDADLEAERAYDERFPLPPPKPKPREVWLYL